MKRMSVYEGDTSIVEALFNGTDLTSGISPDEYDNIYDVTLTVEYRQPGGFQSTTFIHLNHISGEEIVSLCALRDRDLHNELNTKCPNAYLGEYDPSKEYNHLMHRIVDVDKRLVSYPRRGEKTSHSSTPSNTASNSSSESSIGETIGGLLYLIVAACVFFFYAAEDFGIIPGMLYSFFWSLTIPIHYFFF